MTEQLLLENQSGLGAMDALRMPQQYQSMQ